jgi:spermidine/putrescine transport system permease protein
MNKSIFKYLTISPAVLWLTIFFVLPMIIIIGYSFLERGEYGNIEYIFTLRNYRRLFDSIYFMAIIRTLQMASINAIICLLLGYPLAYFIAKQDNTTLKNILLVLVILPFWTNFLVRTYSWMILLGDEGIINNFLIKYGVLSEPMQTLHTPKAVIIGLVYNYLPFIVLPLYSSLEKIDGNLISAAKDLGASTFSTFVKIILPLSKSGIFAGFILVFIPSIGEFITPNLLGGSKVLMLGNIIARQFRESRDWPFGSAIALIVMGFIMIVLIIDILFNNKNEKE